jgi:hypothetical protein
MSAHKTQLERVRGRLHAAGYISRNQCLSQFPAITRLGARIDDLEHEGYVFEAKRQGGDYVYKLISRPGQERMATPQEAHKNLE